MKLSYSTTRPNRPPKTRRGAIIVLAAITMTVMLAFAAFAIDIGYIAATKSQLQNAADAAALAGVLELSNGSAGVRSAAEAVAALNKAGGHSMVVQDQDVVLGTWDSPSATFTPLSGNAESNADTVQVTCYLSSARGTPLKLFFAGAIGTSQTNLTTSAMATRQKSRCGLIIGLPSVVMSGSAYTDSYDASQGPYKSISAGTKGTVCTNGNITMSGTATIHGDAHPGTSGIVNSSGGAIVTGTKTNLTKTLSYASVDATTASMVNNNKKIPISDLGKVLLDNQGNFTMSGSDGVTLPAGTYYFAKIALSGSSTIRIVGPTTIYATGDVNLSGGSVANLSLLPKNLQLFPMGQKCDISGNSNLYAVVYGPTTQIIRSGSADFFGAIIGAALTMSGSGGIHADVSLDYTYLGAGASQATLVQ